MRKNRWRWLLAAVLAAMLFGWVSVAWGQETSWNADRGRWLAELRDERGILILRRPVSRPGREIFALRGAGTRLVLIPLPEYNKTL